MVMKTSTLWILLIATSLLAGCGKKDKAGTGATNAAGEVLPRQGGCDTRAANQMCAEYFGQPGGPTGIRPSQKAACEAAGGTPIERCPTGSALGRCVSGEIRIQQLLMYAPMTKDQAELLCKGMGDGTLGPA